MTDDTFPAFSFPAVQGKKVTAAFDGGRISSDGGVMLLALAERRLGVAERLARCFPDRRDPARVTHTLADMIRARIFAIGCGYEDADDLDILRSDPDFMLACGRLPDTGRDLASQPTLSRLENAPALRDVIRLTYALVDQWMASYDVPPSSVTLDIDDTCDIAHVPCAFCRGRRDRPHDLVAQPLHRLCAEPRPRLRDARLARSLEQRRRIAQPLQAFNQATQHLAARASCRARARAHNRRRHAPAARAGAGAGWPCRRLSRSRSRLLPAGRAAHARWAVNRGAARPVRLSGRGRDVGCPTPPAQIRTCRITAYGSCLES
jgi:hypothetical protein